MRECVVGELVKINKWSQSFYPFECYDPNRNVFPKQHGLFGEYSLLGIVLEKQSETCLIWVVNIESKFYLSYGDIQLCQE